MHYQKSGRVKCQMNTLTKPGSFLLVLFALLTVPTILYAFYRFSLPFINFFSLSVFMYVATPLIVFLIVTFYLDINFKTKLKRYSILAAILFICCLLIFPRVRAFIVKDTEIKGQKLVEAIQSYKEKNGFWPQSLDDPYFNHYSKTPLAPVFPSQIIKLKRKAIGITGAVLNLTVCNRI